MLESNEIFQYCMRMKILMNEPIAISKYICPDIRI